MWTNILRGMSSNFFINLTQACWCRERLGLWLAPTLGLNFTRIFAPSRRTRRTSLPFTTNYSLRPFERGKVTFNIFYYYFCSIEISLNEWLGILYRARRSSSTWVSSSATGTSGTLSPCLCDLQQQGAHGQEGYCCSLTSSDGGSAWIWQYYQFLAVETFIIKSLFLKLIFHSKSWIFGTAIFFNNKCMSLKK